MATQPMGLGVQKKREVAVQEAKLQEQQAAHEAAQLTQHLMKDPVLRRLVKQMMDTMLTVYQASPDGQAQLKLLRELQLTLEPAVLARNLTRKLMGPGMSRMMDETPAAP
jgi:hypothetical protein